MSDDAVFRDDWCVFSRARRETVICSHQMTNVLAAMDAAELAALRPRLIKSLHRQKQLSDALLLGHLMMAIEAVQHKFICCFKPGSIPTLYQEALTLQAINPHNRISQTSGPKRHRVHVLTPPQGTTAATPPHPNPPTRRGRSPDSHFTPLGLDGAGWKTAPTRCYASGTYGFLLGCHAVEA